MIWASNSQDLLAQNNVTIKHNGAPVSATNPLPVTGGGGGGGGTVDISQAGTDNNVDANITNASLAVTGTFWQATQPVSGTFWQATQPVSGSLGRTWTLASGSDSVSVVGTFWQATQPISGTVTVADAKNEDDAHVSGHTGDFFLGVRNATPTALTSAEGDYSGVAVDQYGVLYSAAHPGRFSCFVQAVSATTQCQAAPAAGLRAYVTSVSISNLVATVQGVDIVYGTGANCATAPTAITHKFQLGTNAITTSPFLVAHTFETPLVPAAANAICLRPTAATSFGATITGYIAP